jgi:hypothetical protein
MHDKRLTFVHAAAAWFGILALAVANGALREFVLVPALGRAPGTALSGVLLGAAVLVVVWAMWRWRRPRSVAQTWRVGAGWLVATLAFEFAFGLRVQGKPWAEVLAAYTFEGGNLWPLVLLALLVAPCVLGRGRVDESAA